MMNRKQCSSQIREAAEKGYVAVTVDHKKISAREEGKTKYPFPAQVYDVSGGY